MVVLLLPHSDLSSATRFANAARFGFSPNPTRFDSKPAPSRIRVRAGVVTEKPSVCTADELHYVAVPSSDWRLALWSYKPSPKGPSRNHPLLLLSGVATNAIGYDLAPESSFARHMSRQGFDTWVLEVRGAGLSALGSEIYEIEEPVKDAHGQTDSSFEQKINGGPSSKLKRNTSPSASLASKRLLKKGLLDTKPTSTIMDQLKDTSKRLVDMFGKDQQSVSPQFLNTPPHFFTILEDFKKQVDQLDKYNWDFDHYLDEDMPAVMEYIKKQCKPKDGKLLAIGHSMGGILLYAMLSRRGFEGKSSGLASVVTLGSSLDYTTSTSSFHTILPLTDPLRALKVPAVPVGILLSAIYPLASRPPYVLAWLGPLLSTQMHPMLLQKLVLNNFCTVPVELLLQLTTAFRDGGLCNRSGAFFYKDHLHRTNVPILALAGDKDFICPPEAVYETVKLIPKHLVTYRVFGEPWGPHYGHYDLVGGQLAIYEVYPRIIRFLSRHDTI